MLSVRLLIPIILVFQLPYQMKCKAQPGQRENSPPNVQITLTKSKGVVTLNVPIFYSIGVVDEEDGRTEYNEIAANEVLLLIRYLPDSLKVKEYLANPSNTNPQPLVVMRNSMCFTCHTATSKLIGPSYDLIAKRYPLNPTSVELLTNRIISGTSGVWGDIKMPPHPDLPIEQVRNVVKWILKNGDVPDQSFYVGTEGSLRIQHRPKAESEKGVYVATASYVDHGIKGQPGSGKLGQHSITLKVSDD
jgi:cytochrome c